MLIESIIRRPKGTHVDIDGKMYAFLPADPKDSGSPHVCEVANRTHAQRFLSIPEGYCIPEEGVEVSLRECAKKDLPAPPPLPEPSVGDILSSQHGSVVDWLNGADNDKLIALFGKKSEFKLGIDKRMRSANLRKAIMERVGPGVLARVIAKDRDQGEA